MQDEGKIHNSQMLQTMVNKVTTRLAKADGKLSTPNFVIIW
jgi:hypothetical protein